MQRIADTYDKLADYLDARLLGKEPKGRKDAGRSQPQAFIR